MKRVLLFLGVLGGAVVAFAAAVVWYLGSYQTNGGTVQGMMGQMMGGFYGGGMVQPMPSWVWASLVALIGAAVVGVVGLVYYSAFPEIRNRPEVATTAAEPEVKGDSTMSWSVLMKTSKPEEKKVLDVLAAHEGKYLQKFVVKESGLSRLKTHRIVSRFAERGVVTVEKKGNTNEVTLAGWLKGEAMGTKAP